MLFWSQSCVKSMFALINTPRGWAYASYTHGYLQLKKLNIKRLKLKSAFKRKARLRIFLLFNPKHTYFSSFFFILGQEIDSSIEYISKSVDLYGKIKNTIFV